MSAFISSLGGPIDIKREEISTGGVRAVWVSPTTSPDHGNVVLFIHGGGYITGSPESHELLAARIATGIRGRALMVDYRLAPEHAYPAQIDDCVAVYRWLLESVSAKRILFAGESAGGALCITTQLAARASGLPMPAAATVMSPWLDFESTGDSHKQNAARDLSGSVEGTTATAQMYLGHLDGLRDPMVCPLYADLAGVAPTLAQVGHAEIMVDDAVRLVARLRQAGVESEAELVPEMQHMFQLCAGWMPEADAAVSRLIDFANRHLVA